MARREGIGKTRGFAKTIGVEAKSKKGRRLLDFRIGPGDDLGEIGESALCCRRREVDVSRHP